MTSAIYGCGSFSQKLYVFVCHIREWRLYLQGNVLGSWNSLAHICASKHCFPIPILIFKDLSGMLTFQHVALFQMQKKKKITGWSVTILFSCLKMKVIENSLHLWCFHVVVVFF